MARANEARRGYVACGAVIDLHTHILPGIDDGAASMQDSVRMAREAWESGVRQIVATPHVRLDYPTTAEQIEAGVDQLRRALAEEDVPVVLHAGAEVDVHHAATLQPAELRRLTLGQQRRYLLLEVPYEGSPEPLEAVALRLRRHAIVPVLAHPERSAAFIEGPRYLLELVAAGCLVQVTSGSLVGDAGRRVRRTAQQLLELGIVHVLASDAHGAEIPRSGLGAAAGELEPALAAYLTRETPAAILAGGEVGDPPEADRQRWWRQAAVRR